MLMPGMLEELHVRVDLKFLIFDNMEMRPAGDCLDTFDLVKKMGFNWGNLKLKELALTVKMVYMCPFNFI